MRMRIALPLWLSLAAVGCSGPVPPTQPTLTPSNLATISSGSAPNAPTIAQAGGNKTGAQQCQQGGWKNLVRSDGTSFSNAGDCVNYGAQGGTLAAGTLVYTLTVTGTEIGDFGWSIDTHATTVLTATTSFSSLQSTSSSTGCTISSVTINDPGSTNPFVETFFSPACHGSDGNDWTEFAQTFWNAGPFDATGSYTPQGTVTPPVWTLTITRQ